MDEPVGKAVGNILEIKETIECLKGNMPSDIKEIILGIGSQIIRLAGEGDNIEENKNKIMENINNGKAYQKFIELVQNQGGDVSYIENTEKFEKCILHRGFGFIFIEASFLMGLRKTVKR